MSDGEYMSGILTNYGYPIVDNINDADLCILNSCTVKNPSEDHFINEIKKIQILNKKIIAAGCVPQGNRKHPILENISIIGVNQIDRIVEVVEETLKGNQVTLLSQRKRPDLDLPKNRRNKYIEIIPINTGCLNACTYCKTKYARGKLGSYQPEAIYDRVKKVIEEGVIEIWLTSEDTGAYGIDIGTNIVELLDGIINILPKEVMLRLGMTNPPYILQHIEPISHILKHPNVFNFLHIPVQSGSNIVLDAMKREYTIEEFEFVVDYFQKHNPNITIMTDIICGFPNETDIEFSKTIDLIKKYKFPVMNYTQFYPRKGTPAAKMVQLSTTISKNRTKEIYQIFNNFQPFTYLVGRNVDVWFNGEISKDGKYIVGHTKEYIQVLVPITKCNTIGKYNVYIETSGRFYITGNISYCTLTIPIMRMIKLFSILFIFLFIISVNYLKTSINNN